MGVCISIYACLHASESVCVSRYMCLCVCVCMCVCLCVCACMKHVHNLPVTLLILGTHSFCKYSCFVVILPKQVLSLLIGAAIRCAASSSLLGLDGSMADGYSSLSSSYSTFATCWPLL